MKHGGIALEPRKYAAVASICSIERICKDKVKYTKAQSPGTLPENFLTGRSMRFFDVFVKTLKTGVFVS